MGNGKDRQKQRDETAVASSFAEKPEKRHTNVTMDNPRPPEKPKEKPSGE